MAEQLPEHLSPETRDALVKVNVEAPVTGENVVLTGGLGATNDVSSSISCAGDSSNMEAHQHDIQKYEDLDGKNSGLSASYEDIPEVCKIGFKGIENISVNVTPPGDSSKAINMEASPTAEEVIRAGGFGATDDISCFLPVASDLTDFEAHIRDVEGYEDLEKDTARPGLGLHIGGTHLHDVQEYKDLDGKNSGLSASYEDIPEVCKIDFKGNENIGEHVTPRGGSSEAIYMEASPTADEVIRAGGFGATDDISSFLPVASDFTDFEAHIRDVEGYEDLEKATARPGLGWTNDST